jgi:hypothetical protein
MEFKYHVELLRFKPSGKWYDNVSFGTNAESIPQLVEEIEKALDRALIEATFDYLITGKEHSDYGLYLGKDLSFGYPVFVRSKYY